MKLIEAVKDYIKTCPHLKDVGTKPKFNVDKLDETLSYSISPIPNVPTLKEYINGDSEEAYQFLLLLRGNTNSLTQYINNQVFYEDFSKWLKDNTKNKVFPDLDSDKIPSEIETINNPYLSATDESGETAVYQITCQLIYRQKGE